MDLPLSSGCLEEAPMAFINLFLLAIFIPTRIQCARWNGA